MRPPLSSLATQTIGFGLGLSDETSVEQLLALADDRRRDVVRPPLTMDEVGRRRRAMDRGVTRSRTVAELVGDVVEPS